MREVRECVIDAGGKKHADKRKQIGNGDDCALAVSSGAVLDHRIQRHDEESGKESEKREKCEGASVSVAEEIEQHSQHSHAHGAERDESVFDLVAGEISRG